MTTQHIRGECIEERASTVIESNWLRIRYLHGKRLPAWLDQALQQDRQQDAQDKLFVVLLPASKQADSLVVLTLHDFLTWSHRRLDEHLGDREKRRRRETQ